MHILQIILIPIFFVLTSGSNKNRILVVDRRTHSSGVYGGSLKYGSGTAADYSSKTNTEYRRSPTSYGSGVESKYSSKIGSYNVKKGYGSAARGSYNHGSSPIHKSYKYGSSATHRSNAKYGSNVVHGSNNHGSYKHGSGSIFYSSKYIRHSSGAIGSNVKYGSSKMYSQTAMSGSNGRSGARGSGSNGGSGTRGSYETRRYNLFSPTREPTESFPEVYQPPPPTNYPTDSSNFPKIKLSFEKPTNERSDGIEVPQIPLSFQIQQGANGWAQYPDSPPVTNAVTKVASKTVGLAESAVTNMKIARKNRRVLSNAVTVTITYDITTNPESVGLKSQEATYNLLIYKLKLSVKSNNFSMELHKMGVPLNISSISFSEYTVFYPTMTPTVQQNVLTSGGVKNDNNKTEGLIIGIGLLLLLFITGGFGVLWYRRNISKSNKKEVELEPRSENSMVDRPMSLARVSNPMIDIIPNQTNRISFDHINCPHNE